MKKKKTVSKKRKEEKLEKEISEEKIKNAVKEILEESGEESKEIKSQEFREFVQQPSIESSAPVLKEIKPAESLEQEIASVPITREIKEDKKETGYSSKYNETDYQTIKEARTEENRILKTSPVTLEPRRMDLHPEQRFMLKPDIPELRQTEGNLEKDYVIKTGRIEQEHRLPFERTKKYD